MHNIQIFILKEIKKHPKNIVRIAMEEFGVTRAAVLFHLDKLKKTNQIIQHGSRNQVWYELGSIKKDEFKDKIKKREIIFKYEVGKFSEDEIFKKDLEPILKKYSDNIVQICRYGFSEIFNNIIDHSNSKKAEVHFLTDGKNIELVIIDFGIGIFKKISNFFNIHDFRDTIVKLHQGKVTTDQTKHSGQGVFFTSRIFDSFKIEANGYMYFKDNTETDDWFFESIDDLKIKGTKVTLKISTGSKRKIKDVFDSYTSEKDYSFQKSQIRVELAKYRDDFLVSRSQAKRLLLGLEEFEIVILDFKNIRSVGQGFVDEIFGVYGLNKKNLKFIVTNANDDVLFMIRRGLADRKFPKERVDLI